MFVSIFAKCMAPWAGTNLTILARGRAFGTFYECIGYKIADGTYPLLYACGSYTITCGLYRWVCIPVLWQYFQALAPKTMKAMKARQVSPVANGSPMEAVRAMNAMQVSHMKVVPAVIMKQSGGKVNAKVGGRRTNVEIAGGSIYDIFVGCRVLF